MPFLPSRIPLIQAPMAGAQGVALAVAVCKAGGLGSLPAAMLTPDRLREQIAMARDATSAPFNVNFFCHSEPVANPEIEARWRNRLAPYYAEAGVDLSAVPAGPARAPFGEALCATIEETRPAVVSFHFGLPPSALLSRVKATGALVLEDLKSPDFDERALFHLMNLAREDEAFVLITARTAPSALQIELRDLRSRLRAVPVVSLSAPDDALFRALIVKFCADRQLSVDESVVSYLVSRIERSYAAVRQAVELLDGEALRLGRPVTRALAADLLRDA